LNTFYSPRVAYIVSGKKGLTVLWT